MEEVFSYCIALICSEDTSSGALGIATTLFFARDHLAPLVSALQKSVDSVAAISDPKQVTPRSRCELNGFCRLYVNADC
jgi:hypothetical protein